VSDHEIKAWGGNWANEDWRGDQGVDLRLCEDLGDEMSERTISAAATIKIRQKILAQAQQQETQRLL
jgi:hypothetical protein